MKAITWLVPGGDEAAQRANQKLINLHIDNIQLFYRSAIQNAPLRCTGTCASKHCMLSVPQQCSVT